MEEICANEVQQKFVQVHRHPELHITACAVSKMTGVDRLSELEEYQDYSVEPNQKWLENPADERAWVKVYHKLDPEKDSAIGDRIQTIIIPMTFLGENHRECWGELQIKIKRQTVRNNRLVNFEAVKLGRNEYFDTRISGGQWVPETQPIVPKKDEGTHGYVALRLYHQDHLPENQSDWRFAPLFASIADKNFYRIDAIWQNEEIRIVATLLDNKSPEIPKFLRQ